MGSCSAIIVANLERKNNYLVIKIENHPCNAYMQKKEKN